ncbi:hypothetical protein [Streptomyces sp. CBMA29]|uniref:hypothetical protein n=1 Tax=Streptomyces sp. CBMA29 TaxID=1896314 RepID=UPI001661ECB1|nr:hypothetical protein [Streptomyces sp. CBMA29]MBD0735346.1 hypothetical protein [Streptomyces sp. CBMA29]
MADLDDDPVMVCAECGRTSDWNPTAFCSWACFDTEPRPGAPEAMAYFTGTAPEDPADRLE